MCIYSQYVSALNEKHITKIAQAEFRGERIRSYTEMLHIPNDLTVFWLNKDLS